MGDYCIAIVTLVNLESCKVLVFCLSKKSIMDQISNVYCKYTLLSIEITQHGVEPMNGKKKFHSFIEIVSEITIISFHLTNIF